MPSAPTIALTNRSSLVAAGEVPVAAAAIQRQLAEHVAPHWHTHACVIAVPGREAPPPGAWPVILVDVLPDPFKVGYHDFAEAPFAYVGVGRAKERGLPWTAVASHEVLEVATNPWATLCVLSGDIVLGLEICDPVDRSFYEIDGVKVSNFVLPAWFRRDAKDPWDFRGVLTAPLVLHAGGNMSSARLGPWTEANPSAGPARARGGRP